MPLEWLLRNPAGLRDAGPSADVWPWMHKLDRQEAKSFNIDLAKELSERLSIEQPRHMGFKRDCTRQ
jgi:hypothetical protein